MNDESVPFTDYLSNLKEGDMVITMRHSSSLFRERVAKVTKTQIVLANTNRYKMTDGSKVGGTRWQTDCIIPPTHANEAAWRKQYLKRWANSFPDLFGSLTPEQQTALYKQVNEMTTANKAASVAGSDAQ